MKASDFRSLFFFFILILLSCNAETQNKKNVINTESVSQRMNYLPNVKLDSSTIEEDTLMFFITDTRVYRYFDIDYHQLIRYGFQSLRKVSKPAQDHIQIYFKHPHKDSTSYIQMSNASFQYFQSSLNLCDVYNFQGSVNKLYRFNSQYLEHDLIDILNYELTKAIAEVMKREPKVEGHDVTIFICEYIFECNQGNRNSKQKVLDVLLKNIKENTSYGINVRKEVEEYFASICNRK